MNKMLPDGDAENELNSEQLLVTERVATAQPGGVIRIIYLIKRYTVCDNLKRPVLPPAQMPAFPTPRRAGPSGLNGYLPAFRRQVNFFNKGEPKR